MYDFTCTPNCGEINVSVMGSVRCLLLEKGYNNNGWERLHSGLLYSLEIPSEVILVVSLWQYKLEVCSSFFFGDE